jgi:hypothetical protein
LLLLLLMFCALPSLRAMDLALGLPKPCDLGSYSVGGSLEAPNGTCRPCPPGYTTQTDQSVGDWECNGEP